jgi:SSS family solute:Na+ symporter
MPSSSINAAAAIETDFYRRFYCEARHRPHLIAGRVLSAVFGVIVVGIALVVHDARTKTLIELQAVMLCIFGSGLLGLFLLGFTTRASNQAAAIATLSTIGLVAGWLTLAEFDEVAAWLPHELWLRSPACSFHRGAILGVWSSGNAVRFERIGAKHLQNDSGRIGADGRRAQQNSKELERSRDDR